MSSYLVDPPGAGASTPPRDPSSFSAEAQASFYEEMRKALGLPKIDLRPLLGTVSSPALIIAGEYDLICGPAQARPIAQGTPGSRLVILRDCGHMPLLESPGEYRQAVLEFLRDLA